MRANEDHYQKVLLDYNVWAPQDAKYRVNVIERG